MNRARLYWTGMLGILRTVTLGGCGNAASGLSDPLALEGAGQVAVGKLLIAGVGVFNQSDSTVVFEHVRLTRWVGRSRQLQLHDPLTANLPGRLRRAQHRVIFAL